MTISELEQVKRKLEHYCAYQERCHAEVESKLYALKVPRSYHAQIMVYLIEENYLNEQRFAVSFARGKHTISYWGKRRIELELKQRNISAYLIRFALNEIDEQVYQSNFEKISLQRWESLENKALLQRKKSLTDYLYRKGYGYEMICNRIEDLLSE